MIKVFAKYIIYSLWLYAYKAAKKKYDYYNYSKIIFSYFLSILIYTIILFILISVSNTFPVILKKLGEIIMYGLLLVCLSGTILKYTLNFELIKKITITKKEKQSSRLVLIALICLIVFIKWIYKN